MSEQPMLPGRSYLVAIGTGLVRGQVTELKYKVSVNTLEHVAAKHLDLNEIGFCNIALDRPIPFDAYAENREMGGFILIDRVDNATIGCGMIAFALRRATNVRWQSLRSWSTSSTMVWFTSSTLSVSEVFSVSKTGNTRASVPIDSRSPSGAWLNANCVL
jgi:sulfate adenylyltransferase subunit 1 (EFTu-like GTPase family)